VTDLADQLRRVRDHAEEASRQRTRDPRIACNEARVATEGLMRLLASAHGVALSGKREKPPTLDVMKRALRHAEVLDRRMEDLVSTVQRYGNRAVHFQPDAGQAIGPDEAALAVQALEALMPLAEAKLPGAPQPAPPVQPEPAAEPPDSPVRWAMVPLAGIVCFGLTWLVLQVTSPPPPEPVPVDVPDVNAWLEAPSPTPAEATPELVEPEATPAEDTPAPSSPVDRAVASVRAHLLLDNAVLDRLDCTTLGEARTWLWAEYGYHFRDDGLREQLAGRGYIDRDLSHAVVAARFTDEDRDNLDALNGSMRELGCDCPKRLAPRRPCPD
jgi:hypothetical protein